MCGRYTLRKGLENISEKIGDYVLASDSHAIIEAEEPRFNIAPTQRNLVLRKSFHAPQTLQPSFLRWGLIPSWSKQPQTQTPIINARSETVAEKPSFKAAFKRRRCLIPADGFYEWKKHKGTNLPYFFSLQDDSLFLMAGIWETWVGGHGQTIESYTVLTTHANSVMAKYHERMPVILTPERIPIWLDSDVSSLNANEREDLFAPLDPNLMTCRPANPIVNNNRSEGPECLDAPANQPLSQLDLGL